jgi:hypothetical protein
MSHSLECMVDRKKMIQCGVFALTLLFLPCCAKGEGGRCKKDKDCEKQLVCNHGYSPPVCMQPGREGEHCVEDSDCLGGESWARFIRETIKKNKINICDRASSPHVCRPPSTKGGQCARDYECERFLACIDGMCTMRECQADSDCAKGLVCNHGYSTPLCRPPGRPGEKCGSSSDCSGGLACVGSYMNSMCKERLKPGETCDESGECEIGLVCNKAYSPPVCRAGKDGEICKSDLDCLGGNKQIDPWSGTYPEAEERYICNEAYSPPVCKLPGKTGHSCNEPDDCSKGLTCIEKALSGTCKSGDIDEEEKCIQKLRRKIYGSKSTAQKRICQDPRKYGELCLGDSDCAGDLFCEGGFDISMPEIVRKCMENKGKFLCDIEKIKFKEGIGLCRHKKGTGKQCKSISECKSGLECDEGSSPPVCKEVLPEQEPEQEEIPNP